MKKKILFLLLQLLHYILQRGKQQPPRFICKKATSKGDIIVALDYKSTNNGRQLCYFGRR
jgi:hypothetical protein